MTKANIPNWGKFLSKILQNQTQMEHSKLGQLLKGNDSGFSKVAHHFNIPSGVLFPSEITFYSGVLPQWISYIKDCKDHFLYLHFPQWNLKQDWQLRFNCQSLRYSQWTILLRIPVIEEFFLKTNLPRNLFSFYRITRITFCLSEFPSGIITFMMTHCQGSAAIKRQRHSEFPSGISSQDLQSSAFQNDPSPIVSVYSHFQNNSTFLF